MFPTGLLRTGGVKVVSPRGVKFSKKNLFFEIVVTSLIFNIFAPDFFKTNSTRSGKFENKQNPPRNQEWTLLPPI